MISSLVSTEGITRTSLAILLHTDNCEVVAPAELSEELRAHSTEISAKAGLTHQQLEEALDRLLENVEFVPLSGYNSSLKGALKLVRDETDAPFAALALARSPSTIITYNKKHFKSRELLRLGVQVLTPAVAVSRLRHGD